MPRRKRLLSPSYGLKLGSASCGQALEPVEDSKDMQKYEHMSNHFYLDFTKVVYGMLYLLVYQNEIGPPHKRDSIA